MPDSHPSRADERHPREVLREHGIWASRSLGQNFLTDPAAMDRLVEAASVARDEVVLEVGTGLGRLAARLAASALHVVTVEIDERLHEIAAAHLAPFPNVTALRCDFLESKHHINPAVERAVTEALKESRQPLKVVSNLPYGISSPAVVNLLEWPVAPERMVLTVQQEVAKRMSARPGTSRYGPLTVYVDHWATVEELFRLPPNAFWPQPSVWSAALRLTRREGRTKDRRYQRFAETVRVLFTMRRKTVARALRTAWDHETALRIIGEVGLEERMRVEELTPEQFAAVAAATPEPPSL